MPQKKHTVCYNMGGKVKKSCSSSFPLPSARELVQRRCSRKRGGGLPPPRPMEREGNSNRKRKRKGEWERGNMNYLSSGNARTARRRKLGSAPQRLIRAPPPPPKAQHGISRTRSDSVEQKRIKTVVATLAGNELYLRIHDIYTGRSVSKSGVGRPLSSRDPISFSLSLSPSLLSFSHPICL